MTKTPLRRLGISLGLIDSLSDGLGEFSTQLCKRIAVRAADWRRQGVSVELHMKRRFHGVFGDDVNYLSATRAQGRWHWQGLQPFDVWHNLHQLDRIGPPCGARRALLTIHDLNPLYGEDAQAARRWVSRIQKRLPRFEALTTISRHVEKDIAVHLEWPGKVEVIHNGVSDLSGAPREAVDGVRPGDYFFHLSRMAPSKNPGCLLDLAAIWPERSFVLAGPGGRDADQVSHEVAARRLSNVQVLRDLSGGQKAWLYANCSAFLFPSLTEGFGLPPLEAMCFGKPVFLSNRASLPEIGGTAAAYFDGFAPQDMKRLIESELPAMQARSVDIRQHAATFDWDRAAATYFRLYAARLALIV